MFPLREAVRNKVDQACGLLCLIRLPAQQALDRGSGRFSFGRHRMQWLRAPHVVVPVLTDEEQLDCSPRAPAITRKNKA